MKFTNTKSLKQHLLFWRAGNSDLKVDGRDRPVDQLRKYWLSINHCKYPYLKKKSKILRENISGLIVSDYQADVKYDYAVPLSEWIASYDLTSIYDLANEIKGKAEKDGIEEYVAVAIDYIIEDELTDVACGVFDVTATLNLNLQQSF